MSLTLKEAIQARKLKLIATELEPLARSDRTVKKIVDTLKKGKEPNPDDINSLKGDTQDDVVMAFASVIGPSKTSDFLGEAKKLKKDKDDPCWDGYVQLGTKKKNGKEVPNCVPQEEAELKENLFKKIKAIRDKKKRMKEIDKELKQLNVDWEKAGPKHEKDWSFIDRRADINSKEKKLARELMKLRKEEVDLDEAMSIGDPVRIKDKPKNVVDKKMFGKSGVVMGKVGRDFRVKLANGRSLMVDPKDLEMVNEGVELNERVSRREFAKLQGTFKDSVSKNVIEFDENGMGFVVEDKRGKIHEFEYKNMNVLNENVEDEMPASPDEKRMAMKQAEFIQYVGREIGEHLVANKEFPEWMQNKLSALHQKAKDMHSTLGAHGGDEMDEEFNLSEDAIDGLIKRFNKTGRLAFRYPRKKMISISGRIMKEKDAIKKMKDVLGEEVELDEDMVYIDFFDKKRPFHKKRMHFTGKKAYDDAVKWGRKNIHNFQLDMVKYELDESVQSNIKKIADFTGTRPEAVEDFVSKHGLEVTKLLKYVQDGGLSQRREIVSAIAGKPNNPVQKKIIKMFSESVELSEAGAKLKDGDSFDHAIVINGVGITLARRGKGMSVPYVVYLDGKEWKTFNNRKTALQAGKEHALTKDGTFKVKFTDAKSLNRWMMKNRVYKYISLDKKNHVLELPMSVKSKAQPKNNDEIVSIEEASGQKLFMFDNKKDAQAKAKEIRGKMVELGPKNFAAVTKDLTVVREEVELDEAKTIKVSFHSPAAKKKWMKKQSISPKEIISQSSTMVELPASMKQYTQKKDHDEIYQVKESVKQEVNMSNYNYRTEAHTPLHVLKAIRIAESMSDDAVEKIEAIGKGLSKHPKVREALGLFEKAESEAQAVAARIALKHKREGTKPEPGTASAEMMKMSEKDLEDFTKVKKGAPEKVEEARKMSAAGHVWRARMDYPFVVRATVGRVSNELVGSYKTFKDAIKAAEKEKDAVVKHSISGRLLYSKGKKTKDATRYESVELDEAKMSDAEVLSAAKKLAANGKDEKAKKFGQGLVDFYKKNDSFTPDQVAGLQNIMKNASFQMAKEEVELDENMGFNKKELDAGNIKVIKDRSGHFHLVNKSAGSNKSSTVSAGPFFSKQEVKDAISKIRKNSFNTRYESVELDEAKMSDAEVLSAAKKLAANGKDEKAKKFGQGLVDFYKKNDGFTPDQVAGLQNIMKNASFQMAKEEVELDEAFRKGDKVKIKDGGDFHGKSGTIRRVGTGSKRGSYTVDVGNQTMSFEDDELIKESVELNENFRTLARHGMGTEPKSSRTKVGLELDYYDKDGSKRSGKIIKTDAKGYTVKDDRDGKTHSFSFLDRAKAKSLLAKHGKGQYNEELDPVDKEALKKKFKKRKDKDIDNDGDVDDSDEYLHNRRKTISKAMAKEQSETKLKEKDVDGDGDADDLDKSLEKRKQKVLDTD